MEERLELTYPRDLIAEPVLYQLGRQFNVVTNIRRANVTKDVGWVVLSLEGEEGEIERAIQFLESKGVQVSPVTKDLVE